MINDIAQIAFEHIAGDYHWGRYGDFRVIINIQTRFINATQLCKLALSKNGEPKQLSMWKLNACANEYIDEVSSSLGIPRDDLFAIVAGGQNVDVRGTYAHPDLIPYIASWASPRFAHRVSRIVNEQLVREYRELIRAKDTRIDELIAKTDEQTRRIQEQTSRMDEQTRQIQEQTRQIQVLLSTTHESRNETKQANERFDAVMVKLETTASKLDTTTVELKTTTSKLIITASKLNRAVVDRVPKHPVPAFNDVFTVYHKPNTLQYRMVRCKKRGLSSSIAICTNEGYTSCVYRENSPNAINLGLRVRSGLPSDLGIMAGCNIILMEGKTTEDLLRFVSGIEAEKRTI